MDSHHSLSASLISNPWRANLGHPAPQPAHHQWQHTQPRQQQWPQSSSASYALQYAAYSGESCPDYEPEYQQPAIISGPSYHSLSQPSASSSSSQASSPRFHQSSDWDADLYRFDPDQSQDAHDDMPQLPNTVSLSPSPPPHPQSPRVKEEDIAGDGFIFDGPKMLDLTSHSFAPMTEVPLRATQATKAMRRLMGVFRLDPFAINNSSSQGKTTEKDTDWSGEKIGPLRYPGREIQFQLDLDDALKPEPDAADMPALSRDRSSSPGMSLSYLEQEREGNAALQPPEWEASPQTSLYSSLANESSSFVPTPAHSLSWLKLQAGSSADGSSYSDSPPMRTLESPPYLSSSRELRMPELQKDAYSRLPSYSASPSLRLPPPTPSSRYISMPQIQSDGYSDEPESNWYNKGISLSNGYYAMQKDESLSSNSALPLATSMNSLANATKYRQPLGGSMAYHPYSSSLSSMQAERLRYP